MKRIINICAMALIVSFIFSGLNIYASNNPNAVKKNNTTELSLLAGLNSDNQGLQVSTAFFLGEMKSEKAVVSLMKIFNNSQNEKVRAAAALALIKIGNGRGLKCLEYASRFDDNESTQNLCRKFMAFNSGIKK